MYLRKHNLPGHVTTYLTRAVTRDLVLLYNKRLLDITADPITPVSCNKHSLSITINNFNSRSQIKETIKSIWQTMANKTRKNVYNITYHRQIKAAYFTACLLSICTAELKRLLKIDGRTNERQSIGTFCGLAFTSTCNPSRFN